MLLDQLTLHINGGVAATKCKQSFFHTNEALHNQARIGWAVQYIPAALDFPPDAANVYSQDSYEVFEHAIDSHYGHPSASAEGLLDPYDSRA